MNHPSTINPSQNLSLKKRSKSRIIYGTRKKWTIVKVWFTIVYFLVKKYPNPVSLYKIVKRIKHLKNKNTVENSYPKLAYVDGRIFFNCGVPGWPSAHFNSIINMEAKMATEKIPGHLENLRSVLIALTKKCPLQCEHCYEGPELNKRDTLTLDDHKKILDKLQAAGIPMIQYGGGDPMAKINDLIELLRYAKKTSDFWIYTSGFNFTQENANRLKEAGLTGVAISLDHHEATFHNLFRRHKDAFQWAKDAVQHAKNANLVVSLSLCTTKEFTSENNLIQYFELANQWGVHFIQLLEPRAVGNYAGKDVFLSREQDEMVEKFFLRVNDDPAFKNYPIVLYPAYHQRKNGCPGAGSKYLYIDTNGYMSNCPFCRNSKTHILGKDHEEKIAEMKNEGCGKYEYLN